MTQGGHSGSRDHQLVVLRLLEAEDVCQPETFMYLFNSQLVNTHEAEELGVMLGKSCKRCRSCADCNLRAIMLSREKEQVVRRVEDLIQYGDEGTCSVSVSYPWTEDILKLSDNLRQVVDFQSSVERRLVQDGMLDVYNKELRKFVDRGAISKLTQEEFDSYSRDAQQYCFTHM